MYKAIYSYSNSDNNVLSFQTGDIFNLVEQIDEHWWTMCTDQGVTGLVPASYLEINKVSQEFVLASINQHLERMQANAVTENSRRNIQKLTKNKESILLGESFWKPTTQIPQQPKRTAPKAPTNTQTSSETKNRRRSTKRNSAPPPPSADTTPTTSPRTPTSSVYSNEEQMFTNVDTGASSKIYNIQVKQGDISILNSPKEVTPYILSVVKSPTSSNTNLKKQLSSELNEESKNIAQFQGKHITISKTQENEFQASQSPQSKESHSRLSHKQHQSSIDVQQELYLEPSDGSMKSTNTMDTSHKTESSRKSSRDNSSLTDHTTTNDTISRTSFTTTSSDYQEKPMDVFIPDDLGRAMIDSVRTRCKISYNKSLAAVRSVLYLLDNQVPSISHEISQIQKQIQDDVLNVQHGSLANEDANRLYNILEKLTEHKEDAQQRNWAIQNDFDEIKELLDDLITTMDEVDPSICRQVLEEDEYRYINELIIYYQMESRPKLRIAMLHVFGCFCQLGEQFVSTLLCSVLPTELAQDIMQDQKDILKFLSSCLTLTMIFCTGESVPYHHYVQFNEKFVDFVLDTIEDPPANDSDDQVPDALVAMLLAFNKHMKAPRHNIIMQSIARRSIFRTLSEKILLLVNREVDPVALFKYARCCPDSVLKFMIDIFGSKETSGIFFTNDMYVLLDIILRQLLDRAKKDKVRTEYLSLFHSMLNTTDYSQHKYRLSDFKRCFMDIEENAESSQSEVDVYIIKEIMNRFGNIFH